MNSMIENLVINMRALGIKSLALELVDDSGSPPIVTSEERSTLAPGAIPEGCTCVGGPIADKHFPYCATLAPIEPEFRGDPNQCAKEGCGEPNGGILGGKLAKFCRKHSFERLGIR